MADELDMIVISSGEISSGEIYGYGDNITVKSGGTLDDADIPIESNYTTLDVKNIDTSIAPSERIDNQGQQITIGDGAVFENNSAYYYGGAIYNDDSGTITIGDGAVFRGNSATGGYSGGGAIYNQGTITIGDGAVFRGNSATGGYSGGGAIYNQGTITIGDGAAFSGNSAFYGGAIDNYSGIVEIGANAVFENNSGRAIYNQGTITIGTNAVFENNSGGAIYNYSGTVEIGDDATFTGNSANYGGAIDNTGTITLGDNATFTGNSATYGGAIYNNESCMITIGANAVFENNSASFYGGAIYNDDSGTITIGDDATFTGNSAEQGGAIRNNYGTITIGDGAAFSGNSAEDYGGAIDNVHGTITIGDGAAFSGNSAEDYGGAISNTNQGTITIGNEVTFSGNSASYGGAIYNSSPGTITIGDGAVFENNSAISYKSYKYYGGAIYNDGGTVEIGDDATFTGNSASGDGGAIRNNSGTITIGDNAVFENNSATGDDRYGGAIYNGGTITIGDNATFTGNSATYGGAIYNDGGTVEIGVNAVFENNSGRAIYNSSGSITIGRGATFTDNSGLRSGAIYNNGGTVEIGDDATFTGNSASSGGAIYNTGTITIGDGSAFGGNSAEQGGAIYNNKSGMITIGDNAAFSGNSASSGGAISNYRGTVEIGDDATFTGNSAAEEYCGGGAIDNTGTITIGANAVFENNSASYGGAIYNTGTITLGDNATFAGNSAEWDGGAIYNRSSGSITIGDNAVFENNSGGAIDNTGTITIGDGAAFSGNSASSAIYNYFGLITIGDDATFTGNSASGDGGAIRNDSGTITIGDNAAFSGNSASWGGAIYNNESGMITIGANAVFENNSASFYSGAILNHGTITIGDGAAFSGNSATWEYGRGGAIYNSGTITIGANAVFENNSASNGGAIYNDDSGTIILGSAIFATASDTIYNEGTLIFNGEVSLAANVTLEAGSTLENNANINFDITSRSTADEAFINDWTLVSGEGTYSVTVSNSQSCGEYKLIGNAANYTGSITVGDGNVNYGSVAVDGEILKFNNVDYLLTLSDGCLYLKVCDFTPPVLEISGNVDYWTDQNVTLTAAASDLNGVTIYYKKAEDAEFSLYNGDVTVSENATYIFRAVDGYGNVTEKTVVVDKIDKVAPEAPGERIDNQEQQITIGDGAAFTGHSAEKGGAIYNDGGTVEIGDDATFTGNSAAEEDGGASCFGGAIYTYSGSITIGANAVFENNSAYHYGGAIYNDDSGTITIGNGAAFSGNSAISGGAIYNDYGTVEIGNGAAFSGNSAGSLGGAIDNSSGSITIGANAVFENNSADYGGAIYNYFGLITIGDGAAFSGNSAEKYGGAIYNSGTITIGSAIFATASDTIYNEGTLIFNGDVSLSANVTLEAGSILENNANINFNLTQRSTADEAFINDWTLVSGNGTYSVTVSDTQTYGEYLLAANVRSFNKSITVKNENGTGAGTLSLTSDATRLLYANVWLTLYTTTQTLLLVVTRAIYNTEAREISVEDGAVFSGNNVTDSGAAIYNSNAEGTITLGDNVAFKSNTASYNGGAIYNSGTITIGDSVTFENNSAFKSGGAIYNYYGTVEIGDSATFTGNSADYDGGAIYNSYSGTITIGDGAAFTGNSAERDGGAIFNTNQGAITIGDNVTFENNSATFRGGAIYNDSCYSTITIGANAVFENNSASSGGAIYNDDSGTITIGANAVFENNSAVHGGAIYNDDSGAITIGDNATFTGNSADYGGAIYNSSGSITIGDDAAFTGNSASWGGAIYNDDSGTITIGDGAVFSGNSATGYGYGGAICNSGTITIGDDATFSGNSATGEYDRCCGGAIRNSGTITIGDGAVFENNSAIGYYGYYSYKCYGGAIYNDGGTVEIGNGATFTGNGATFTGNSASSGGAIYNNYSGSITIGDGAAFSGNSAADGGAIYNDATITIGDDATFTGNSATGEYDSGGGAIYNSFCGMITIGDGATFTGNSAEGYGGAINNYATITIGDDATFTGNSAEGYGGAINNGGTLTLGDGATFTGNSATGEYGCGGAIYNDGTIILGSAIFATASDTIYNEGTLIFNGDVSLAANITLAAGSLQNNGNINFDITERSAEDEAFINDWSLVSGEGTYSVTVSDTQSYGEYQLIGNASGFTGSITVGNGTVEYGSTTLESSTGVHYNGVNYILALNNGNLTLTIAEIHPLEVPVASADITEWTNQNVAVSATFAADSVKNEYSLDGRTWRLYTGAVVMESNGTVYFRSTGFYDNVCDVVAYEVTNIDKVAPIAPTAAADITGATNGKVTVTATFASDVTVKEYSLDGKAWQSYTAGIVFDDNGSVFFRGYDKVGNLSSVTEYKVTNIDKVAPEAPVAAADVTEPTEGKVTVTAAFASDVVVKEYSLDNKSWQSYADGVVCEENCTVYFRGFDAAGNVSKVAEYKVNNITDLTPPEAPTAAASITKPTNGNVTVTAAFASDVSKKEYSLDGKAWQSYTAGVVMSDNGKVYFRGTDEAGNISAVTKYIVSNIDKVAPEAPVAVADVTDLTNGNVTVTAAFASDVTVKEYSLDGKSWKKYDKGVTVADNCTVYFRGFDAAGNVSKVSEYKVSNITDLTPPEAPVAVADITAPTTGKVTVTAEFSEDSVKNEYSLDGKSWKKYNKGVTVKDNCTVYFRGADSAGNISAVTEYIVSNIDKVAPEAPTAAADITDATNGNVTVTAEFASDVVAGEYSFDKKVWQAYENSVVMESNGKVYFRGFDAAGNVSKSTEYAVSNIDKTAPVVNGLGSVSEGVYKFTFTGSDAASGMSMYRLIYTVDGVENVKEFTGNSLELNLEGKDVTFKVQGRDNAGNWSECREIIPSVIDIVAGDTVSELIFISSKYNEKTTGKKQNGVKLVYGKNAFASVQAAREVYGNISSGMLVIVDSKINAELLSGTLSGAVVTPTVKENNNSYSYKASSTSKNSLDISVSTGDTEFVRFAKVSVSSNAEVQTISGGKENSKFDTKTVEAKNSVTDTSSQSYSFASNGKFNATEGAVINDVSGFATVTLDGSAQVGTLAGGSVKAANSSKIVDGKTKDQKKISESDKSAASGKVTLGDGAHVENIDGFMTVSVHNATVGKLNNYTSEDSKSETTTIDETKETVTRKVTVTHKEGANGTLKATGAFLGDVNGFGTVNLKDVQGAGSFKRLDAEGDSYSTVKETLTVKTNKGGSVDGVYSKTETFNRAGKFTAENSAVGEIVNFNDVTIKGGSAGNISNSIQAKMVETGVRQWASWEEYAADLADYDFGSFECVYDNSNKLSGKVTLDKGASVGDISNFKTLDMTDSSAAVVSNITKVAVKKGSNTIAGFTGTDGDDTLTVNKNAVLTIGAIDFKGGAKDKLVNNGTVILSSSDVDLDKINLSGKGEFAAAATVLTGHHSDTILNLGATSENFRGTAFELADDLLSKAVKWDGKADYNGWLGSWESSEVSGSDELDCIKFTVAKNSVVSLDITGDVTWELQDKRGNAIDDIASIAAGDYILKIEQKEDKGSLAYSVSLK